MDSLLNAKFVSSGTVDELYFPTVAICNINQIRKSFIHELNLSEYELKQIKRMIYTGSDRPMTQEEISTVVDIATRRVVYLKGNYVTKLRKNISSWKTLGEEYK